MDRRPWEHGGRGQTLVFRLNHLSSSVRQDSLFSSRAASRVTHPFTLIFTSTQVASAHGSKTLTARALVRAVGRRRGSGECTDNMPKERVSPSSGGPLLPFLCVRNAGGGARVLSFTGDARRPTHIIMHKRCAVRTHGSTRHESRKRCTRTVGSVSGRAMAAHRARYGIAITLSEGAFLHVWLSAWLPRGTLTRDLHRFAHQVGRDGVLSHLWGRGPGAVVSTCMLIGGMAFFRTTTVGAHVLDFS